MFKKNTLFVLVAIFVYSLSSELSHASKFKWQEHQIVLSNGSYCKINTRHLVLKNTAISGLKIEQRKGKCKVVEGKWEDFYSKEVINDPKIIDIDHVLPKHEMIIRMPEHSYLTLYQAQNDLSNLVVTHKKINRMKGDWVYKPYDPFRTHTLDIEKCEDGKKKYCLSKDNIEIIRNVSKLMCEKYQMLACQDF